MGRQPSSQLRARIDQVQRQSGGALTVHWMAPDEFPDLVLRAAASDDTAALLLRGGLQAVERIRRAHPRRPMLCGCCPRALVGKRGYVVVLALPMQDDASAENGISFALCPRCSPTRAAIEANALVAIRRVWSDARVFGAVTHPEGGRA